MSFVRLLLSILVCPKAITFRGFHCITVHCELVNIWIFVFIFSFYLKTLLCIEYGVLNTCVKHFIWILSAWTLFYWPAHLRFKTFIFVGNLEFITKRKLLCLLELITQKLPPLSFNLTNEFVQWETFATN